jgi:MEDS: MEthanogen/methylotroph, DcmR Sensory domain
MTHSLQRECVVRGHVTSEHLVQLFDDTESLAETVADFLFAGWVKGQTLLVVARPHGWAATLKQLLTLGCNVEEATATGRLLALDAATTLAGFSQNGLPRADLYQEQVGTLVRHLVANNPAGLRIYGEMVDILAAHGDYLAAEQLEGLWNDLAAECPFTLLCGYASANFADPRTDGALQAVCRSHSQATVKPTDLLGAWLLSGRQARFHLSDR